MGKILLFLALGMVPFFTIGYAAEKAKLDPLAPGQAQVRDEESTGVEEDWMENWESGEEPAGTFVDEEVLKVGNPSEAENEETPLHPDIQ